MKLAHNPSSYYIVASNEIFSCFVASHDRKKAVSENGEDIGWHCSFLQAIMTKCVSKEKLKNKSILGFTFLAVQAKL